MKTGWIVSRKIIASIAFATLLLDLMFIVYCILGLNISDNPIGLKGVFIGFINRSRIVIYNDKTGPFIDGSTSLGEPILRDINWSCAGLRLRIVCYRSTRTWAFALHLWPLLILTPFAIWYFSYTLAKSGKIRPDSACPNCGYDVRASMERCPECGAPLMERDRDLLHHRAPRK